MGNKLFGVDIAKIIDQNVSSGVLAATLTKITAGTRTGGQLTGGTNPTSTPYACRGFIDEQALRNIDGTLIQDGMKKIVLIGDSIASLAVPEVGDEITIEGSSYKIELIERDPAAATYTCGVVKKP